MTYEDQITNEERPKLQRRFGGHYVARRSGEVIVASDDFSALMDTITNLSDEQRSNVIIEYFDPVDVVSVY